MTPAGPTCSSAPATPADIALSGRFVAALVGGTGVAIVFGLLLLGISRGKTAQKPTTRYVLYILSGLCGVVVVGVMALGVYAMTQKPSSAKPKPKATATLTPASGRVGLSSADNRVA